MDGNSTSPRLVLLPPPSRSFDSKVLTFAAIYALLFIVGFYGNTAVLTFVFYLTHSLKQSLSNTFRYVTCLCVVDSLVIISIPFMIVDLILGHWIFGTNLCKLYYLLESASKLLSTFLLAALAFDRFAHVCHPYNRQLHAPRLTATVVSICVFCVFSMLSPMIYNASARVLRVTRSPTVNYTMIVRIEYIKCVDNLSHTFRQVFTCYTFAFGFLLPITLMILFYCFLLRRIQRQSNATSGTHIPFKRITMYTMGITLFYLICWLPYWLMQLYSLYLQLSGQRLAGARPNNTLVYAMYLIHALPYVNSALNWILYAQMNTQFRKRLQSLGQRRNEAHLHRPLTNCTRM